jgi:predicted transcriptional regulator
MADTTIKVDSAVRDRLAVLAAEHGTTTRDFVAQLAAATPTRAELQQRQDEATAYIKAHLRPDFGPDDIEAGHQIWDALPVNRPAGQGHNEDRHAGGDGGRAA